MSSPTQMEYIRLGYSGLKVSKIILGGMSFGSKKWFDWVLEEEDAIKQIKAAYDLGINTWDTADMYSNGISEVIIGKAIKEHNLPREKLVIMTKLYAAVSEDETDHLFDASDAELARKGFVNQHGLSRKHIFDAVKQSLARLQLDYIDVLQCHRFDYGTPIEETMQALHDVVQAGYVRYIGMSSCYAYQFHIMQSYAIQNRLTPFISMQNHYSLVYREEEREMFPTIKHFGVGSIPWSPLARGTLTRPRSEQTRRGKSDNLIHRYGVESTNAIVDRVEELAKKKGITMAQLSLAWVLSREGVTAPIIGTSSPENLAELAAAIHIKLSEEERKYLEEPYQPQHVFGHN